MSTPSNYRWLVVAVTVLNQAVSLGIGLYCFAIFSIPWLEQFDISRGQLMLAIAAFQVANGLAAPFIGHRLDKMPLLWPVITGYILFCSGLGLLSIANAYWQIILIYATFFGVGQILFGTFVSQMLINRWFTTDKGMALGISATGTSLGGIVFPLLIAQALSSLPLSVVLQTIAIVAIVVLLPLNFFIFRVEPPAMGTNQSGDGVAPLPEQTWTTQSILSSKTFWIPMMTLLSVSTAFVGVQANLGAHLTDLDYPTSFTGQMIAVISAMMIVGKLLYGKLSDRVDHGVLLLFMSVSSIIALVILIFTSAKISLLAAAVLLGLASGGLIPMMGVVYASRFGVASFGKVIGLAATAMIFGALGPIYAAWIYDLFGSYQYAFASFIILFAPGLILLKWLPPPLASQS